MRPIVRLIVGTVSALTMTLALATPAHACHSIRHGLCLSGSVEASVTAGDFDGDGRTDLAAAGEAAVTQSGESRPLTINVG